MYSKAYCDNISQKGLFMKKRIFYSTTNDGKFEEIKRYVDEHKPSIEVKQFDKELPEIQSTNQEVIAIDKAEQAWKLLKEPVLVDNSGVYFDHYNNFPGTMSKFIFHGLGFEGLLKLVEDDNRASLRIYMVYKENEDEHHIFEGVCEGKIVQPKNFDAHPGRPYDAIFMPEDSGKTMAQIRGTEEEKKYAFRLRALQKFLDWLKKKEAH
jgi:non-canonical purine NTP pyrophosphatase (RdgB/HAM1 family)